MPTTLAAKVHELTDALHLSQEQVGEIVGASGRTVARWSAGQATPQPDARRRLLELRYVADEVAKVIRPEDVNLWMFEPNRLLDGDTPAERIRQGRYKDVLAAIAVLLSMHPPWVVVMQVAARRTPRGPCRPETEACVS